MMYKFNPHAIAKPRVDAIYLVIDGDYRIIDPACDLKGFRPDRFAEHLNMFSGLFVMPELLEDMVDVFCRVIGIGRQDYSALGLVVYDADIDEWDTITYNPERHAWYADQQAEDQYAIFKLFYDF